MRCVAACARGRGSATLALCIAHPPLMFGEPVVFVSPVTVE